MSYFDFFFHQGIHADHVREVGERSRRRKRKARARRRSKDAMELRVEELEKDLGFVSLLLCSVMAQLDERGHISRDELRELIKEVDGADGEEDGRLDVAVLRELAD